MIGSQLNLQQTVCSIPDWKFTDARFVIASPHPKKFGNLQVESLPVSVEPLASAARNSSFSFFDSLGCAYLMMFGVDQLLFVKCLLVFFAQSEKFKRFFGCCLMLFCLMKNGKRELQGELGFPFIWHCFANASCHVFASPISSSKQTLLKGKPR